MYHKTAIIVLNIMFFIFLFEESAFSEAVFALTPSLVLEERYDSNVEFKTQKTGDFVTSTSPLFKLSDKNAGFDLNTSYRLDSNTYLRKDRLNYISHWASVGLAADLSKTLKLKTDDSFSFSKDYLLISDAGLIIKRTTITANTADINIEKQLGKSAGAGLTLTDRVIHFKDPSLIDTRTDAAIVYTDFEFTTETKSKLSYTFTFYQFDTDATKDVQAHTVKLGITEKLTPTLTMDLAAGVIYIPGVNGQYYPAVNAGFERAYKDLKFGIAYSRDLSAPTGLTDEVDITDRVAAKLEDDLSKEVKISILGNLSKIRSEPSRTLELNSYEVGGQGAWQIYKWLAAGAGVSYFKQWNGNGVSTELDRGLVFINFTLTGNEWRL